MKITGIQNSSIVKKHRNDSVSKSGITLPDMYSTQMETLSGKKSVNPTFGAVPYLDKVENNKKKLLNQLDEYLELQEEVSPEDYLSKAMMEADSYFRQVRIEKQNLIARYEALYARRGKLSSADFTEYGALNREWKALENKLRKKRQEFLKPPKPSDEKIEYALINRFKTEVLKNNFNLESVFLDYYSDLEKITTIDELKKRYPKIKIPMQPQDVIAQKIVDTLTRDFYKNLDELLEKDDFDAATLLVTEKLKGMWSQVVPNNEKFAQYAFQKTAESNTRKIMSQMMRFKNGGQLDSIPENRKNKVPQITKADLFLLAVDFDDYVLNVLRQHYLEGKKLSDIIYQNPDARIPVGYINDSAYKFQKQSEKVKSIIKSAQQIKSAERNYSKYEVSDFRRRLNYYASTPIANDERILDSIIQFDNCRFGEEDKKQLELFLNELDKESDGEKTVKEVVDEIYNKNIRPLETERKTEQEKMIAEQKIKAEQKQAAQLSKLKTAFDDAMNFLYLQSMNNLANNCSKYRPENLDEESVRNANFIINIVNKEIADKENRPGKSLNKSRLEASILRWSAFNNYKKNDPTGECFRNASKYGMTPLHTVDIDKAGKYIINYQLVESYPDSMAMVKNPDILKTIMEKEKNQNKAIEYLCKYNEYETLMTDEKTRMSKILGLFDVKNSIEKAILKIIVEKDYVNTDTVSYIPKGSDGVVKSTFGKEAKRQILEKYKFPVCLDFLDGFEYATTLFAPYDGATGIKLTGKNNKALLYKMEAKLSGNDDRLFSSMNDYNFDIYSAIGLH